MITAMIATLIPTLTRWGLTGRGWMPEWGGVFNHLWQSTVFAAVAALLALGLRKNHARARYWLWLAASCKFLVPFSLLVGLGLSIGTSIGSGVESIIEKLWPSAPAIVAQPEMTVMFDEISQPFTQVSIPAAAPEHRSVAPELLFALWACGCAIVLISWFRRWLRVRAAVLAAKPISFELAPHPLPDGRGSVTEWGASAGELENEAGLKAGLPARLPAPHRMRIMSSPVMIEPGIFGIFRPVLLLPEGIADRLTPAQLQSILAHELCHVKRRDNLAAAIHMIVEAAFWFHPLVWWIGGRLVEERERACDEEVLRSGSEPGVYAESILQVCKFYLESPLKCVAGVTGSDLKKRIESIMSGLPGRNLSRTRKLLLVAASIGAIAGPIVIGVMHAPAVRAQGAQQSPADASATPKWEVVSVKPCDPSTPQGRSGGGGGGFSPGTLSANCAVPMRLIEEAYGFYANGRTPTWKSVPIEGAPSWLNSERYTIAAKAESPQGRAMMFGPMMQKLLEDRFKLKIRREIREVPVYNLTIAKGGPRNLKTSKPGSCIALDMDNPPPPSGALCKMFSRGRVAEGERKFAELGVTMAEFSDALATMTGRNVIDKTGLPGTFDIEVQVSVPDEPPRDPSLPRTGPQDESDLVFAVVQKLGMKLESAKGPGVVYVIEHVERPSDNFEPPAGNQEHALHPVAPLVAPPAPPAPQPYMAGPVDPKSYVIGAQDILKIAVWREPDLSKSVAVRPDGRITLALIGDVEAAGLTPARLAATLEEAYREKLRDPHVMVEVIQVNSKHPGPAPAAKQQQALHTVAPQGSTRALTGAPQMTVVVAKPKSRPTPPVEKPLAFEVASVKPNKSSDNRGLRIESLPGGGFSARGVPVYLLIIFAYDLPIQTSRISGGPEWLRSDRFDIEAKAGTDAIPKGTTTKTREAMTRLMLQALLAERFKLVVRIDKKELPVYAAVAGKNGPKLQKSKIDEKDCPDSGTRVAGTTCHTFFGGMGRGLHGEAVDMSDLVQFVAQWADRPVVDKTGIQGLYNIQTDGWTRMVPSQPSADGTVSDEAQALADPARPTLQMIFDRLGLKLESQKAPIDMYVIVSAARPAEN